MTDSRYCQSKKPNFLSYHHSLTLNKLKILNLNYFTKIHSHTKISKDKECINEDKT